MLAFFLGMPGWLEVAMVGLIVMLLFGNRLPGVMRSLGRSIVEFKKGTRGIEDDEPGGQGKPEKRDEPVS